MNIKDNPKDAASAYIEEIANDYCVWYSKSCRKNHLLWFSCQLLALTAGFGTSLLAALMQGPLVDPPLTCLKWLLVILPFIGSLATTIVVQSRVFLRWKLREKGLREFESLVADARAAYAAAPDAAAYTVLHESIRKRVDKIEKEQSDGFFSNAPSFIAK